MRLGEKLVADRLITVEHLEVALRAQVIYGGRLGTNLVELGSIDLDTLARALAELTGVPAALQKHFEQVGGDPQTIAMLPPRLAEKHRAVPLGLARLAGRQLVVAFMDPLNVAAVDEIGFATGTRITPCVAPELRILYYLERFYGVMRKNRYLRVDPGGVKQADAERRHHADLPLAGLLTPAGVENAEPVLPRARTAPTTAPPYPASTSTSSSGGHAPLTAAVLASASMPPVPAPVAPPVPAPVVADEARRPALGAADVAAALDKAASREEIGDLLVDYLRSSFSCGLVLIVKDDMALGWKGFVTGGDAAAIETIALPLGMSSMLRVAYQRRSPFRGAPPADGAALQSRFYKLLRLDPAPREVLVAPVVLRGRVVNLIYAHGNLPDDAMTEVAEVCNAAADAFARLIRAHK